MGKANVSHSLAQEETTIEPPCLASCLFGGGLKHWIVGRLGAARRIFDSIPPSPIGAQGDVI